MTYRYIYTAAPIIGNLSLFPKDELQPHAIEESDPVGSCVSYMNLGSIDANEFVVLGACKQSGAGVGDYWASQRMVRRDLLDAYEFTDRTARVTDCASEGL